MTKLLNKPSRLLGAFIAAILLVIGCQKNYYHDSGLQNGVFDVPAYEFLQQQPYHAIFFDSLLKVIDLSGMKDVVEDSAITFFAPTDHAIEKAMDAINAVRYGEFKDSLYLQDIPAEVWRQYLSRYIFHGKYMLKDIPRWDGSRLNVYPGMNLQSWNGYIMNLGVRFSDYDSVKDVGPRQVAITSIGDLANPDNITSYVATSDLQTKNAIVHVLDDNHEFGFSVNFFVATVEEYIQ